MRLPCHHELFIFIVNLAISGSNCIIAHFRNLTARFALGRMAEENHMTWRWVERMGTLFGHRIGAGFNKNNHFGNKIQKMGAGSEKGHSKGLCDMKLVSQFTLFLTPPPPHVTETDLPNSLPHCQNTLLDHRSTWSIQNGKHLPSWRAPSGGRAQWWHAQQHGASTFLWMIPMIPGDQIGR